MSAFEVLVGSALCKFCERGYAAFAGKSLRLHGANGYIYKGCKAVHLMLVQDVLGQSIPKGHVVHHRNGIRTDNRLDNLAVSPRALNSQAKLKAAGQSSVYRGVARRCIGAKWDARIRSDGQQIVIGRFASEAEAGRAYDMAALAIHGRDAGLNNLLSQAEIEHVLCHAEAYRPAPRCLGERGMRTIERIRAALADPEGQLGPMPEQPHLVLYGKVATGRVARVSAEGWRKAAMYKWHVGVFGCKEYVYGFVLSSSAATTMVPVKLHRFLKGCKAFDGRIIDHCDGDTLNNTEDNLRDSTPSANARNKASKPGSTSQHIGVSWSARSRKWRAQMQVNGKMRHLGMFECQHEAARAYQGAVGKLPLSP